MTGYGRSEVSRNGVTALVEVRSVNSRFLEVVTRMPRTLAQRENDLKELVRSQVGRGKLNVTVTLRQESNGEVPIAVNASLARSYYKLLNQLKRTVKIREGIRLEHLLQFSDIWEVSDTGGSDEQEWGVLSESLQQALGDLNRMRQQEGKVLAKDIRGRIDWMDETIDTIERLSKERVPQAREKLQERIAELVSDKTVMDQNRLELEIALLADKLDVTEECVRFRSHTKFFLEAMAGPDPAGRRLNFLIQEMNREANTVGSKSNDADIAHLVVKLKEELEKTREQIQNIE